MIRAVLKSVVQEQADKVDPVVGLVAKVAGVVSEQADDRSWRTLPESISVARTTLPQGAQIIEFQTENGSFRKEVTIGERFAIIPIRLTGGTVYVGQPNTLGAITPTSGVESKPTVKKPARKPAKKAE